MLKMLERGNFLVKSSNHILLFRFQQIQPLFFTILLNQKEEGPFDVKEELKKLEEKWMEKLQPYGERGYHK